MKKIEYFEVVDMGIRNGMGTPRDLLLDSIKTVALFNGYASGFGTDAESALEDLLQLLQEDDFDITGLEGQIKESWEPSKDEGDGVGCYYHFGITFKFIRETCNHRLVAKHPKAKDWCVKHSKECRYASKKT